MAEQELAKKAEHLTKFLPRNMLKQFVEIKVKQQHDKNYYPIYIGVNERVRPGLCTIINQEIFPGVRLNISSYLSYYLFDNVA